MHMKPYGKNGNLFTKINEIVDEISEKECSKSQIEIESNKDFI